MEERPKQRPLQTLSLPETELEVESVPSGFGDFKERPALHSLEGADESTPTMALSRLKTLISA